MDVWTIVSVVVAAIAALFGVQWGIVKGKISQVASLVRETLELINALLKALEDDKVSSEEVALLKSKANDVKVAFKVLLGKKVEVE